MVDMVSSGPEAFDGYPAWMAEVFASNMAYRAKSKPNFAGDLQHDVRDAMLGARVETLEMWTGWVARKYLFAARMLGLRDDPIADSLAAFDEFDVWSLAVAHDLLAAWWRYRYMAEFLGARGFYIDEGEACARFLPHPRMSGLRRSTGDVLPVSAAGCTSWSMMSPSVIRW